MNCNVGNEYEVIKYLYSLRMFIKRELFSVCKCK